MSTKWSTVRIGEVLRPVSRKEAVDTTKEYRLLGVRLDGRGPFLREVVSGAQTAAGKLYRVAKGDFIYSRLFACRGAFGVINDELNGCYVSGEFPTFLPVPNRLDVNFLRYWFRLPTTLTRVDEDCAGSTPLTRNRFKEQFFLALELTLPPLAEQRRVVGRIEELAAKIREARTLRQQSFQEAENILSAARHHILGNAAARAWSTMKLDEVAPINMGQSPPGESYNDIKDGVPLLNGPTEFGEQHPTAVQWTSAPTKLCKPGDILLCVRGATTGRMNWADKEYCIGRGLAALTMKREICEPEYIYHFVATQTHEMLALAAGSTFPNLPGAKLKGLEIFVPHLSEQRRIVAELDAMQAEVDALKRSQAETTAELDALLPSILDKAFKGEL